MPGDSVWPQAPARRAVGFVLLAEVVLLAAALLVQRRIPRDLRWLSALLLLFSLVYVLTHTEVRFRAPIEPLLLAILAAAALQAARARSARRAAVAATAPAEQPVPP
jgi:thiol:disulfide interchange protein